MTAKQTIDLSPLKTATWLRLTFRRWGNRRQGNLDAVSMDADKKRFHLSKKLLDSDTFDAIVRHQGQTKKFVLSRCNMSHVFEGCLVATPEVAERIDDELLAASKKLKEELVPAFMAAYATDIEDAKKKLNGQFCEDDYPAKYNLPFLFDIEWSWFEFKVPEDMPKTVVEREKAKLEEKFTEARQDIIDALRLSFEGLVASMADRLTIVPGEKQKIFRDSLVTNMRDFIEAFNDRNIFRDGDLEALVAKAKGLLDGVNPQLLRDNLRTREKIADAMTAMKKSMVKMIDGAIERKASRGRQFNLDEE